MRDPEGKLKDIYEILKRYFGYESFRGGQEKIVRCLLSGGDALAVMPTGAGKSLCFQLPALAMDGITLVVSPLISLMQDQVRALGQNGIRAAYINSALTPRQIHLATQNAAQGIYKIIYVAPERLLTDSFLDFAQNADISLLAVDEAHCISQWGQDFRPGYLEIGTFISKLKKRPAVAAFTATATKHVRQDIISKLGLKNPLELTTGFDRPNLYFEINSVISRDDFLIRYIREHKDSSGIVYCATRKETDRVSALLSGRGFSCAAYHAGLSDDQRKQAQEDFTFDRVRTIVATTAFGMGIDKSDVRYVIHYNMPSCMEDYYQQAGRAGRDGAAADCILLYSKSDVGLQRFLITRPVENDPLTAQQRQAHLAGAEERLQQMTVIIIICRKYLICQNLVRKVNLKSRMLFHKCSVFKQMQILKHRAVFHIVPVDHGIGIGEVLGVEILREDRAGIFIIPIGIVIQVEGVVGGTLHNGIIYIRIRNTDPCVTVRTFLYDLCEVNRAFDGFLLFYNHCRFLPGALPLSALLRLCDLRLRLQLLITASGIALCEIALYRKPAADQRGDPQQQEDLPAFLHKEERRGADQDPGRRDGRADSRAQTGARFRRRPVFPAKP